MKITKSTTVTTILNSYPKAVQDKLTELRSLIFKVAEGHNLIDHLEETTKWGEAAYVTKIGSTLRMDWKAKNPDHFALYFQCTSQLVPTFRFVFNDILNFDGNRAIVFNLNEPIPTEVISKCIEVTLTYHKAKKLPTLGL